VRTVCLSVCLSVCSVLLITFYWFFLFGTTCYVNIQIHLTLTLSDVPQFANRRYVLNFWLTEYVRMITYLFLWSFQHFLSAIKPKGTENCIVFNGTATARTVQVLYLYGSATLLDFRTFQSNSTVFPCSLQDQVPLMISEPSKVTLLFFLYHFHVFAFSLALTEENWKILL
jgi:hypothetical protein